MTLAEELDEFKNQQAAPVALALKAYAASEVNRVLKEAADPLAEILAKIRLDLPDCEFDDENSDHCACAIDAALRAYNRMKKGK